MVKDLDKRMIKIMQESKVTQEQLIFLEERLREGADKTNSNLMKSLFLFIIVSAAWFMIKSAIIKKLNFFGMEFEELSIPLLLLPPIAAFLYYNMTCYAGLKYFIYSALEICQSQILQSFKKMDLQALLTTPTFLGFEGFLSLQAEEGEGGTLLSYMNSAWLIIIGIIIFFFLYCYCYGWYIA
jgi:hypothetical protein